MRPGERLGAAYECVSQLGSGAAGEVWRVDRAGVAYAAKLLRPEHSTDPAIVDQFIRERTVLQRLRHPHTVRVEDLVIEGDRLAIVMELVTGGTLRDRLRECGSLPPREALTLLAQLLEALDAAHACGVVHRDVKPDNMLLDEAGRVRVTDFGIAEVLAHASAAMPGSPGSRANPADSRGPAGPGSPACPGGRGIPGNPAAVIGTPAYMPPELRSAGQILPAGDVYSAGAVLYEMLAGHLPELASGPPPLWFGPHGKPLWDLLLWLLAPDPAARPDAHTAALRATQLLNTLPEEVLSGTWDRADTPTTAATGPANTEAPGAGASPHDTASSETHTQQATPQTAAQAGPQHTPQRTLLRAEQPGSTPPAAPYVSPLSESAPQLGEADRATVIKPLAEQIPELVVPEPVTEEKRPWWKSPLPLTLIGAGVALVIVVIVVAVIALRPAPKPPSGPTRASAASDTLPTGLTQKWKLRSENGKVTVEISLSAQKAPLSGEFLQAFAKLPATRACPKPVWDGADGNPLSRTLTGVTAQCGWQLDRVTVKPGQTEVVTAEFRGGFHSNQQAQKWLDTSVELTAKALASARNSTSFVPQRLRDINIVVPDRVVNQTTIEVSLVPVWADGPDPHNPLYRSPAAGEASSMLEAIAGGERGVRLSDGCHGALAVSADGLVATALSMHRDCVIHGSVGNFTELSSNTFQITSRQE